MMSVTHPVTRAALGAVGLVALALLVLAAARPAGADQATLDRIQGDNRFETAAQLALSEFGADTTLVYVASGQAWPDALPAGAAAGASNAPLLLVGPDSVPDATTDALAQLDPDIVNLVGGSAVISDSVQQELEGVVPGVRRVAGNDRYETAVAVMNDRWREPGQLAESGVFVAGGQGFADPMAGAAAAASREAPLLLVGESSVPDVVTQALAARQAEGGIGTIYLLGGTAVIDASVEAELEQYAPVERLSGLDRFETASAISAHFYTDGADEAFTGTGRDFADVLAAAPVAGVREAPVLLSEPDSLPDATRSELERLSPARSYLLGGEAAVSAEVEQATREAVGAPRAVDEVCFDQVTAGTVTDAQAQEADEPRADLIDVCVGYDGDDLVLRSRVAEPTDPIRDAGWQLVPDQPGPPRTGMEYQLNISGEQFGDVDYTVEYQNVEFEAQHMIDVRVLEVETNTLVCADESTGAYVGGWYETRLDSEACFGGAPPISVNAAMFYRTGTAGNDYFLDRWPGPDGFMGPVWPGEPPVETEACFDTPSGTTQDGSTDGDPNDVPQADIVEVCASYEADEIELRTRVAEPTDPTTDPNWTEDWGVQAPPTVSYTIAPSDEPGAEYVARYTAEYDAHLDEVWLDAEVVREGTQPACFGDEVSGDFDGEWYRMTVAPACIGDPVAFAFDASMTYRFDSGFTGVGFDFQPEGAGEMFDPIARP